MLTSLDTMQGDGSDYSVSMKSSAYMEKQPALHLILPDVS